MCTPIGLSFYYWCIIMAFVVCNVGCGWITQVIDSFLLHTFRYAFPDSLLGSILDARVVVSIILICISV